MYRYTICFCLYHDSVLMLHRHRHPNQFLWNGIGGKLEIGETSQAGVFREVAEEADIELEKVDEIRCAGVVTWPIRDDQDRTVEGMYAFVARLGGPDGSWTNDREIPEGILSWKPIEWVCDPDNGEVVGNIPHFLPLVLNSNDPMHYQCRYADGQLLGVYVQSLETEAQ